MLTQAFDEVAKLVDWGPDGIYFAALQKTYAHVYRLDPAKGAIHRLSGPDRFMPRPDLHQGSSYFGRA